MESIARAAEGNRIFKIQNQMKSILFLLFLYPFVVKSQIIADTTYYSIGGGNYTKVVAYRNAATSSAIPPARLNDSTAALRVTITPKLNTSDSTIYQSKYRSDTARNNTYTQLAGKQATGNYLTANQTVTLSGDISGSGATAITTTIGASKVTNAMLAGSIDLTTKVTGILPFASNAGVATAAAATTGTVSVPLTSRIITVVPSGSITFNGTNGVVGQEVTFVITTSGVTSFNITFGTAFKSQGILATGTTTAKVFTVSFICVAATPLWDETARTIAQ